MAFLDNSGDIILDAVLTDTGRKNLARGDGTFRIVKFALGDDEINYGLFDGEATTGREDLEIMQTPVLEAFTNNTSTMNSFLQTYTNNQTLLYLPVIKINDKAAGTSLNTQFNSFLVAVDARTTCGLVNSTATGGVRANLSPTDSGVLQGWSPQAQSWIRLDQGVDNLQAGTKFPTNEFYENQYMIEMDSRFGQIVSKDGKVIANPSFIDDDQIASYYLSRTVNGDFVTNNNILALTDATQVINGPRGSILEFQILVSQNLSSSDSWFTKLGGQLTNIGASTDNWNYIDTIIRVTGLTTGYRVDVPVRYIRAIEGYDCSPPTS